MSPLSPFKAPPDGDLLKGGVYLGVFPLSESVFYLTLPLTLFFAGLSSRFEKACQRPISHVFFSPLTKTFLLVDDRVPHDTGLSGALLPQLVSSYKTLIWVGRAYCLD